MTLAASLYAFRIAAPTWGRVATGGIGTAFGARGPRCPERRVDIAAVGRVKRLGRAAGCR